MKLTGFHKTVKKAQELHPEAKQFAQLRKDVGDKSFANLADKVLEAKKRKRARVRRDKELGLP